MNKYEVQYSPFLGKYAVINAANGVAQSFWEDRLEADQVARDLTAQTNPRGAPPKQPPAPRKADLRLIK